VKKVKIVPKADYVFYVYESPEALYCDIGTSHRNDSHVTKVNVQLGEIIEVEWYGCEVLYTKNSHTILNLVRFAKGRQPKNKTDRLVASIGSGWVTDDLLPVQPCQTDDIDVDNIDEERCVFNMPMLFQDDRDK
jgi:hypothetical protein